MKMIDAAAVELILELRWGSRIDDREFTLLMEWIGVVGIGKERNG